MSTLPSILANYRTLSSFCDSFWNKVRAAYPDSFACAPGCSTCCELPSVNYLEAYIITAALASGKQNPIHLDEKGPCPFLDHDRCSIYEFRPLICRTHGLLLRSKAYGYSLTISCPFNFTDIDLDKVDPAFVLEIDTVSDNLARLNAAFCLMTYGNVKKTAERIALGDLAAGKVTRDSLVKKEVTND